MDSQSQSSIYNRIGLYGYLYNYYAVINPDFVPKGWRIPTEDDIVQLVSNIGGYGNGGKLKETGTSHWLTPNTGATNEYLFSMLPSGKKNDSGGYSEITQKGYFWAIPGSLSPYEALWVILEYNNNIMQYDGTTSKYGVPVRLIKNDSNWTNGDAVKDYEGNIYPTVKIGNQVWTAFNWRSTKLNNGQPIQNVTDNTTWSNLSTPAYCAYNNDESYVSESVSIINSNNDPGNTAYDQVVNSIKTTELKITRIIFSSTNLAQQLNTIKETLKTMYGDSIEQVINIQNYIDPSLPNTAIIIDLKEPIVINSDEFLKMTIEPNSSANLILEYEQEKVCNNLLDAFKIQNTLKPQYGDIFGFDEMEEAKPVQEQKQIVIIDTQQKTRPGAQKATFPRLLIFAALAYGIYKLYQLLK